MDAWPRLQPCGDAALLIELGDQLAPELNARAHALAGRLAATACPGLGELVPAYCTVLAHYDPALLDYAGLETLILEALAETRPAPAAPAREIVIPVRYGGADGPDLEWVAAHAGLTPAEVVALHTGRLYRVYLMGFTPGFAYLGELDERLAVPRWETPRLQVPAGSVGIAGRQTGVYPLASPGGWRLLGRTALPLFDLEAEPPFRLNPGDSVRFTAEG